MRRAAWVLAAVAVAAIVAIGLSQASDDKAAAPTTSYEIDTALARLEGAPAPLAALHEQHSQLLEGGPDALRARLDELEGHPVVINKWGSWCTPCRAEFPVFQRVAARKGKTVAFIGIDGMDPADDAREFLEEFPLPYPSYIDRRGNVAAAVEAAGPFPITVFVDRKGEVEIALAQPYDSVAALERDIKRYLDA